MSETGTREPLGDYLKSIEGKETRRAAANGEAVYIRIDGNRFSKFTKGMGRPFDARMAEAMQETTRGLVKAFGAAIGYTQSDEISLVLWEPAPESELAHGGKFQKLVSRTASRATALFYQAAMARGLDGFVARQFPEFDARAFPVSLDDAAKAILWRMIDARKNAIQMVAQAHFSPKQLHGKHGDAQLAMLREIGVEFDAFSAYFREGTLFRRETALREMTADELAGIPEKYRPTGAIERTDIVPIWPHPDLRGPDRASNLFHP